MPRNMYLLNKRIKRQREKIMKEFIAHNAYTSENAVTLEDIGLDENTDHISVKAAFTSLMFNGIIKGYEGVFWFDEEEYVKQMTKNNNAIKILVIFAVLAIMAFFIISYMC